MAEKFHKDLQYFKFCAYGFLKNLRFFEAFLLLFFREKGLSYLEIGTLYAIQEITINILEIPTGIISDALGRRRTMIWSFLSYIISFIIYYFATDYYWFLFAIVFYGFGDAFRTGTHKAMIFEYLRVKGWQDQKVHYYGHTRSWSQRGSAVSALIAAFLIFYSGNYRSIFLYSTIPYLLDLILMTTYPKYLDGEIKHLNKDAVKQSFVTVLKEFWGSVRNPKILTAIANQAIYTGYYKAVKDFIQPFIKAFAISAPFLLYLNNEQKTAIIVGVVYFIIYGITAITAHRAGHFAERFRNIQKALNISMIAGFGIGLLIGICFNFNLIWLSIIGFIFIYAIENVRKPMGIAYIADLSNHNILSSALSVESQAESLFAAMIAPIIGFFADKYGLGNAFIYSALILLILTPVFKAGSKRMGNV